MKHAGFAQRLVPVGLGLALLAACAAPARVQTTAAGAASPASSSVHLTLAAYSAPAEAYAKIIELFQADYKAKTGQDASFATSYQGSGAQARAVAGGLEADVV